MEQYNELTIKKALQTKWAGKTVHFADETDSTNRWAKELAKEGAVHGTLCAADFQSAGRGRFERRWSAGPGTSVMFTLLLRPQIRPEHAPMLTLVMGLSVALAVQEMGYEVSIKWPNDVVIRKRKICGILTEMGLSGENIDYVIIGTGINVGIREFPEDMKDKATSLCLEKRKEAAGGTETCPALTEEPGRPETCGTWTEDRKRRETCRIRTEDPEKMEICNMLTEESERQETGSTQAKKPESGSADGRCAGQEALQKEDSFVEELPDRNEILGRVLRHFERCYEIFCADSSLSGLLQEYQQLLANKDQPVRVLDKNAPYEGICLGINAAGELLVKTEDGTVRTVNSGEVSVRGLYSYV